MSGNPYMLAFQMFVVGMLVSTVSITGRLTGWAFFVIAINSILGGMNAYKISYRLSRSGEK
jgi:hypothetical protein